MEQTQPNNTTQQNTITEEQIQPHQTNPNWIDEELKNLNQTVGNMPDALHFPENETVEVMIDVDKGPFKTFEDKINGAVKKIIPCIVNGEEKTWWLNVHNPLYKQLLEQIKTGQKVFKVLRTGQMKNTRYAIIK